METSAGKTIYRGKQKQRWRFLGLAGQPDWADAKDRRRTVGLASSSPLFCNR